MAAMLVLAWARPAAAQWSENTIAPFANSPQDVHAADVNGDGAVDILSVSGTDKKIAWYENRENEFFVDPEHVISTSADAARDVFATDIDGDGHTDVLSASADDNKIAWYENDGSNDPSFTTHTITTSASDASSVYATNVDGDGDIDLLSASRNDDKIAWYENDGTSNPSFTTRVITTSADEATSVFATDVDGDGNTDVLSASAFDDKIAWYENDSSSDPSFTTHTITTSANLAESVFATDVDGDGDTDVLSATSGGSDVSWYENDGSENFTAHTIFGLATGASSVFARDVNGDGAPDALSAHSGNTVAWYENQVGESGADEDGFGDQQVITADAKGAESVYAADMDGNGHTDVLDAAGNDDRIAWHENDGNSNPTFTTHILTIRSSSRDVYARDVNGDAHTDVLSASNRLITLYESDGSSDPLFKAHVITFNADEATGVFARDIDGDTDTDVLSADSGPFTGTGGDKIAWYENDGSSDPSFTTHTITTSADFAKSVYATDVDSDGDTDVLSASSGDDKIAWYENDGSSDPSFTTRTITTSASDASSVYATNVDGDGDTDVLSASGGDNTIAWYENDGSSDPSFATRVITTKALAPSFVQARDVDRDGHTDVLAESESDPIAWHENDGTSDPSFTANSISAAGASSISVSDVDGDGQTDVVSNPGVDIAWYENPVTHPLIVNDGSTDGFFPCDSSPGASDVSDGIGQASSGQDVQVCPGSYSESTLDVSREVELESGASLTISDQLTLTSNALDAAAGTAVLESTSETSTAAIAASGSGSVTGELTFERFVDKGDGASHFRFLGIPTTTALDDEGSGSNAGNLLSNIWTQATGSGADATVSSPSNASVFDYDEGADLNESALSSAWTDVSNLDNTISPGEGRAMYLFADRDPGDETTEGFPATLTATGPVQAEENSGNAVDLSSQISYTSNDTQSQDGWNLIANPFMAPIDWETIEGDGGNLNNVDATIYVYDAANGDYATYTADGSGTSGGSTGGTGTQGRYIAPFQGVFVKANGSSPNVGGIDASEKAVGQSPEIKGKGSSPQLTLRLRAAGDSSEEAGERAVLRYGEEASAGKDAYDAYQLVPLKSDYALLATEMGAAEALFEHQSRPVPAEADTVDLAFKITEGGTYELGVVSTKGMPSDWKVILKDLESGARYDLGAGETATFTYEASKRENKAQASKASAIEAMLQEGQPTVAKATSDSSGPSYRLFVGPTAALPVELASFEARAEGSRTAVLTWKTASEQNNAGFAVQRKTAGASSWTEVGFVESKAPGGTTTEAQTYRFADETVPFEAEKLTYRLRQKDLDGTTSLSKEATVQLGAPSETRLHAPFPNPASRQVTLRYETAAATDLQIGLYDVLGRRLRTLVDRSVEAGRHEQTVSVGELPAGTYFLRLRSEGLARTRKLTVVR